MIYGGEIEYAEESMEDLLRKCNRSVMIDAKHRAVMGKACTGTGGAECGFFCWATA